MQKLHQGSFLFKEDYMRWFLYAPLQLLIMDVVRKNDVDKA